MKIRKTKRLRGCLEEISKRGRRYGWGAGVRVCWSSLLSRERLSSFSTEGSYSLRREEES